MTPVAIILVSDLHAGPDNNHPELQAPPGKPSVVSANYGLTALAEAIKEVIVSVDKSRRILVCAGDLSTTCHSLELERAGKFLSDLAQHLEIDSSNRVLVPGNHDVDWRLTELGTEIDRWYDTIRQRKFKEIITEHAKDFVFPADGLVKKQTCAGGDVELFLLDSPFEDRNNNKPHHGQLGEDQIKSLDKHLSTSSSNSLKVIVLHHHVFAVTTHYGHKDFSQLQDAAALLNVLQDRAIPLVIHGHQHYPHFATHSNAASPALHQIIVVGSGSTTANEARIAYQVPSTFHVIMVDDPEVRPIRGAVYTRMFSLVNGWQLPSHGGQRVPARRPFGFPHGHNTIQQWVDEAIAQCASAGFVKLDRFLDAKPDGTSLCTHEFRAAILNRLQASGRGNEFEFLNDAATDCTQMVKR